MTQVAVALISLLAVSVPLVALSKPRRMLRHIRDEASTLKELPKGHSGRAAMEMRVGRSVAAYDKYVGSRFGRMVARILVGLYVALILLLAAIWAIGRYKLGHADPLFDRSFFVVLRWILLLFFIWVASLLIAILAVLFTTSIDDMGPRARSALPRRRWTIFLPWGFPVFAWKSAREMIKGREKIRADLAASRKARRVVDLDAAAGMLEGQRHVWMKKGLEVAAVTWSEGPTPEHPIVADRREIDRPYSVGVVVESGDQQGLLILYADGRAEARYWTGESDVDPQMDEFGGGDEGPVGPGEWRVLLDEFAALFTSDEPPSGDVS